jgi:hypothetical protein
VLYVKEKREKNIQGQANLRIGNLNDSENELLFSFTVIEEMMKPSDLLLFCI